MYTGASYSRLSDTEKPSSTGCSNDDEERDSLFSDEDSSSNTTMCSPLKRSLPWIAHAVAFLIWLGVFFHTRAAFQCQHRTCLERFNAYCKFHGRYFERKILSSISAPVLDGIDADYEEKRFKYSLWHKSPYKGPPTPEVHQAWHDIMQCG